jgi:hypothetical protein
MALEEMLEIPVKVTASMWDIGKAPLHRSEFSTAQYAIQYFQGEWAAPTLETSMLFYYNNLVSALQNKHARKVDQYMRGSYRGYVYWWCEVDNPCFITEWPLTVSRIAVEKYWSNLANNTHPKYGMNRPSYIFQSVPGTMVADRIMLLDMITMNDLKMVLRYLKTG